jgi:hypothetical protein
VEQATRASHGGSREDDDYDWKAIRWPEPGGGGDRAQLRVGQCRFR